MFFGFDLCLCVLIRRSLSSPRPLSDLKQVTTVAFFLNYYRSISRVAPDSRNLHPSGHDNDSTVHQSPTPLAPGYLLLTRVCAQIRFIIYRRVRCTALHQILLPPHSIVLLSFPHSNRIPIQTHFFSTCDMGDISGSIHFRMLFETALLAYGMKTGIMLVGHPLALPPSNRLLPFCKTRYKSPAVYLLALKSWIQSRVQTFLAPPPPPLTGPSTWYARRCR